MPQHRVAHHMAVGVVDTFEMVGVDHQQGKGPALAQQAAVVLMQFFVEPAAVVQAGQCVDGGQACQLLVGLVQGLGALGHLAFQGGVQLRQLLLALQQGFGHRLEGAAQLADFLGMFITGVDRGSVAPFDAPGGARQLFDGAAEPGGEVVGHGGEQQGRPQAQQQQAVAQRLHGRQGHIDRLAQHDAPAKVRVDGGIDGHGAGEVVVTITPAQALEMGLWLVALGQLQLPGVVVGVEDVAGLVGDQHLDLLVSGMAHHDRLDGFRHPGPVGVGTQHPFELPFFVQHRGREVDETQGFVGRWARQPLGQQHRLVYVSHERPLQACLEPGALRHLLVQQQPASGLGHTAGRLGDTQPGVFLVGGLAQLQRPAHGLGVQPPLGQQGRAGQQPDFLLPLPQVGAHQRCRRLGTDIQGGSPELGQLTGGNTAHIGAHPQQNRQRKTTKPQRQLPSEAVLEFPDVAHARPGCIVLCRFSRRTVPKAASPGCACRLSRRRIKVYRPACAAAHAAHRP